MPSASHYFLWTSELPPQSRQQDCRSPQRYSMHCPEIGLHYWPFLVECAGQRAKKVTSGDDGERNLENWGCVRDARSLAILS